MRPQADNAAHDLIDAIADLIRSGDGDFNELAVAAARFQAQRSRPLARLWQRSGLEPSALGDWRQVPALPCLAFKNLDVGIGEAEAVFTSSGTSGSPSRHPQAYLDLYRAAIDAGWNRTFRSLGERPGFLALVPDPAVAPQSSLAFMVDHLLREHGAVWSTHGWSERGLRLGALRSWLARSQRAGKPVAILATSLALGETLERLAKINLRFRLPAGSVVVHTGGRKTRTRDLDRGRLVQLMGEYLGLEPDALRGEYGMTELTSHFYGRTASPQDSDRGETFSLPPWTRVRILDPATLDEVPAGDAGLIAVFDLANLSSSVHVLTQDLGVAEGDRFRVLGRAEGAELRGCSLLTEQLRSA